MAPPPSESMKQGPTIPKGLTDRLAAAPPMSQSMRQPPTLPNAISSRLPQGIPGGWGVASGMTAGRADTGSCRSDESTGAVGCAACTAAASASTRTGSTCVSLLIALDGRFRLAHCHPARPPPPPPPPPTNTGRSAPRPPAPCVSCSPTGWMRADPFRLLLAQQSTPPAQRYRRPFPATAEVLPEGPAATSADERASRSAASVSSALFWQYASSCLLGHGLQAADKWTSGASPATFAFSTRCGFRQCTSLSRHIA